MRRLPPAVQTRAAPRILITGFGPFPGVAENASARLVRALTGAGATASLHGARVRAIVLPVAWALASRLALREARRFRPHVILHFGVSRHAEGFRIESQATNGCDRLEDCLGFGPRAAFRATKTRAVTLDAAATVCALRRAGIAACLSDCAGAYLCNHVLYESLAAHDLTGGALVGFIHIPQDGTARPLDAGEPASRGLLLKGARIILGQAVLQARRRRSTMRGAQ